MNCKVQEVKTDSMPMRVLKTFISAVMVLGLSPILTVLPVRSAYADVTLTGSGTENSPYLVDTADELTEAVAKGGFIKLDGDIDLGSTQFGINDKVITLDLAGKTITSSAKYAITLGNSSLTINDTSVEKTGTIKTTSTNSAIAIFANNATVSLEVNAGNIESPYIAIEIDAAGDYDFNGGVIKGGSYSIWECAGSTCTMTIDKDSGGENDVPCYINGQITKTYNKNLTLYGGYYTHDTITYSKSISTLSTDYFGFAEGKQFIYNTDDATKATYPYTIGSVTEDNAGASITVGDNTTYYGTIHYAHAAATEGQTITLLTSCSTTTTLSKAVTYASESDENNTLTAANISAGTFNCAVTSTGTISGGTYNTTTTAASITGGTFTSTASATSITGGVFASVPETIAENYAYAVNSGKTQYMIAASANIDSSSHKVISGAYAKYYGVSDFVASGYTVLTADSSKDYVVNSSDVKDGKLYKGAYSWSVYGNNAFSNSIIADGYGKALVGDSNNNYYYIFGKDIQVSSYKVVAGTFDMDPSAYVDTTTYEVTDNGDGTYTVALNPDKVVCTITRDKVTTEYFTVTQAAAAAQEGDTIVLTKNVIGEQVTISSGKTITLDLGSYCIDNSATTNGYALVNSGNVTIKGGADSYIKGNTYSTYINKSAKVTFDSTFAGKVENGFAGSCTTSTNLLVQGGYFKEGVTVEDACIDAGYGKGDVTDGYYLVSEVTAENAGCYIIDAAGNITYYFLTNSTKAAVETAWSAADGNKLVLLKDCSIGGLSLTSNPGSGKSLILDLNGCALQGSATQVISLNSGVLTICDSKTDGSITGSGSTNKYSVNVKNGTTLNISGGTLSPQIYASYSAVINMYGGTVSTCTPGMSVTLNLYDGTITETLKASYATVNVYGGTISSATLQKGTLNVFGGSITGELDAYGSNSSYAGTVNVSGGYVNTLSKCATNKTTLTGGEYGQDVSSYVDVTNYAVTEVIANTRWAVEPGAAANIPNIVKYLTSTNADVIDDLDEVEDGVFKLTEDIDISGFAYAISQVGNKTIDLNGHTLTVAHNRLTAYGTLNLKNSSTTQGALVETATAYAGYAREQGQTIKVNGTLNVNGTIRIYGDTVAIRTADNATLTIDGATVESNYEAAIRVASGVTANISNAIITSASSSVINDPYLVWAYAIRAHGTSDTTLNLTNSTVTGVHGAVGVSGAGTVANIDGCTLTAKNSSDDNTDAYGALYVAENAVANVYDSSLYSDRENWAAYSGNNDVSDDYGTINLYGTTYLSDKGYAQENTSVIAPVTGYYYATASDEKKDLGYDLVIQQYVASITKNDVTTYYATLKNAISGATAGDTIDLLCDITESPNNWGITKSLVIDFHDYALTSTSSYGFYMACTGTLTLKNGTYNNNGGSGFYVAKGTVNLVNQTVSTTNDNAIYVMNPSNEVTINVDADSVLQTTNTTSNYGDTIAVCEENSYPGVTINVYGKVLNASHYGDAVFSAICTNGQQQTSDDIINIYDGAEVKSTYGPAMYLPAKGSVTISGGTVEGKTAAIAIKSGNLTITGGTIKATGEDNTPTSGYSNGINSSGAAIQIESNSGYYGNINVAISGSPVITSVNSYALYEYIANNGSASAVTSMSITGGKFASGAAKTSDIMLSEELAGTSAGAGFISGGYFTLHPDASYVADGKTVINTPASTERNEGYLYTIGEQNTTKYTLETYSNESLCQGGGSYVDGVLATVNTEDKTNYTFKGWYLTTDGTTATGDKLSSEIYYSFPVKAELADAQGKIKLIAVFDLDTSVTTATLTIAGGDAKYSTNLAKSGNIAENGNASIKIGSKVTLTATDEGDFIGWYDSNNNKVSGAEDYTFILSDNVTLTAKYATPGTSQAVVSYKTEIKNPSGEVLTNTFLQAKEYSTDSTAENYVATAASEQPVVPSYLGYTFTGYTITVNGAQRTVSADAQGKVGTADLANAIKDANNQSTVTVTADYVKDTRTFKIKLHFKDGSEEIADAIILNTEYTYGDAIKVWAGSEDRFNGTDYELASYTYAGNTYTGVDSITIRPATYPDDGIVDVYANYVEAGSTIDKTASAFVEGVKAITENGTAKTKIIMSYSVPTEWNVTAVGFVMSATDKNPTVKSCTAKASSAKLIGKNTGTYTININQTNYIDVTNQSAVDIYVRGYITYEYTDANGTHTNTVYTSYNNGTNNNGTNAFNWAYLGGDFSKVNAS